jgi:ATP phosphoribosyltransferase
MNTLSPIRLALPSKGHLAEGAIALLRAAGYRISRPSDRVYEASIAGRSRFHVVFMRPIDIVAQVDEGRCHLGITGGDVFAEHASEEGEAIPVIADLGYAACQLVVAVPESWIDVTHMIDLVDLATEFKTEGKTFRVSTKYPRLVREHFRRWGIYHYQMIASDGALELHPSLGISDVIVDLSSSGTTLKENRLREIEGGAVLDSSAMVIGHGPSLSTLVAEGPGGDFAHWLDAIDAVRAAEDWLHLEIAGEGEGAESVAAWLESRGARHLVWNTGKTQRGPAWRATAMVPSRGWESLARELFDRGAARVSAHEPRFLVERGGHSSWDLVRARLGLAASNPRHA